MELKVGDVLYRKYAGKLTGKTTIERVTKTMAFAKNVRFRKEYHDGSWLKIIGAGSYDRTMYYLETEKLKKEYFRLKVLSKVKAINFDNLETDKLIAILNTL